MAIEANNWEVVFFLVSRYEQMIMKQVHKGMNTIVQCFQKTPKYMKAKLYLTKMLLGKFNFDGYKILVNNIRQKIQETSLENNLFSHSPNPLLTMCLTYEVLKSVAKRCFSLSYDCIQLNNQLKEMMLVYIEQINKTEYIKILLFEKDYQSRDVLSIAVSLDLMDLIQSPKVVAAINRIYKSDYDCSGSLFEMSSAYQIMCSQIDYGIDLEKKCRFYAKRNISMYP